ncbi:heme oxygenase (biliverdin-producing) [Tomitella biformata]|uniref:biliverdin-producing heme oxygenase n=1 Tax=Tomitella biformata TaxID=630403 RepID=UPI000465B5D9|nr:biliverdin-producing heme oxygenase [Tomitella biformata]
MQTKAPEGFAAQVKIATDPAHRDAEGSQFMSQLLAGELPAEAYVALLAQNWFIYRDLEAGGRALAGDAVAEPFLHDSLLRESALEQDLAFHLGEDWQDKVSALPATERYAARLREVSPSWPAGFVAHHYLRYLGDLSGGQIIRRIMERTYGYETDGVRFYIFDEIAKPKPFKDDYRAAMDALDLSEEDKLRFIDEVSAAFQFNKDLFVELDGVVAQMQAAE